MFKRIKKVVPLPTNKTSTGIWLNKDNNRMFLDSYLSINNSCIPQHLYILSDEEIKEGDWCYDEILNAVFKTDSFTDFTYANQTENVLKIIATTDESLAIEGKAPSEDIAWRHPLPQPSRSFIEVFVREYNKGNVITEVMVEYEFVAKDFSTESFHKYHKEGEGIELLKVNPKDNTITIRKCNEKGDFLLRFVDDVIKEFPETNLDYLKLRAETWIEQNLQ